jgi:prevent-host-death family protein
MIKTNTWKLQDAKARFSEVVREARAGEPQEVTVHGKPAVAVVDLARFEVRRKSPTQRTTKNFVEESKKYRGEFILPQRVEMDVTPRPIFAEEDSPIFSEEDKK